MDYKKTAFIFLFLALLNIISAQEEISVQDQNLTENETILATNEINETNETEVILESIKEAKEIIFKNFIPREFKLGDAQFSIQVQNKKDETVTNIIAFISGKGFSTYDVTPIDSLQLEEKGYILVNGNFKESGLINLTIKIDQKTFYQEVNVLGESEEDIQKAENLLKQQEEKKKVLAGLSQKLESLEQNYSDLEAQINKKEEENYDLSNINLNELKKYIRESQGSILGEHVEEARVNLVLATKELNAIEEKLAAVKKLPFIKRFKEHLIVFSSIAGAVITFFALYELLKKKGKEAVVTIGSIKQKTEPQKDQLQETPSQEASEKKEEEKEEIIQEKEKEKKPKRKKKT